MKPKLSKSLLAAVLATFAFIGHTINAADSISINFYSGDKTINADTVGELGGISASGWNNILGNSGTYSLNNQAGAAAGQLHLTAAQSPWGPGYTGSDVESILASSYLDLGASNSYSLVLTSDYWIQDVVLYLSGDGDQFGAVNVNGTSYVGGVDVQGTGAWGNRSTWTDDTHYYTGSGELNADKAIKVTQLLDKITVGNIATGNSTARATLAGMQIIDRTDESAYATTLGTDTTAAADATWTKGDVTTAYQDIEANDRLLLVTADTAGSTMTLADADSIKGLGLKANTLTVTSAGTVSASSLHAYQGATLHFNAALSENQALSISGTGEVHLGAATSNVALTNIGNAYLAADGNTLASLSNSGTLNINGDTSLTGSYTNTGRVTIAAGKTLSITSTDIGGTSSNPGFVDRFTNIYGEGTLAIAGNVDICVTNDPAGSYEYAQQVQKIAITGNLDINGWGNNNWLVGNGKTLEVTGNASFQTRQTLTVETGGALDISGKLTLGHAASGNNPGHLAINGGSATVGSLYLREGNGNDSLVMTGGSLEFTDGDIGSVITRDNNASEVTISGGTLKATQNSWAIDLGEGGTAMSVGNVTIDTTGDYTITLGHANLTGTITLNNNANLILTDASISSLSGFRTDNEISYTGGEVQGNGFASAATYIIVDGAGDREYTVSYNGSTHTLTNGRLIEDAGNGIFYVNTGTESVSTAVNAAPEGALTSIILSADTTLNIDTAMGNTTLGVTGAATANIQEGNTLHSSSVTVDEGATLTLQGSGSYTASAVRSAGKDTVSLYRDGNRVVLDTSEANRWIGNVIVDSVSNTDYLDLNTLGHEGSTVTLRGSSGYFKQANNGTIATFKANVRLENTTEAAFKVTNGNSGNQSETSPGNHYIFEGSVSGDGNFLYDKSLGDLEIKNRQTFEFAGDVSEWTGKLENLSGLSTFRFTGDATEVNINTIQTRTNGTNNKMDIEFVHEKEAIVNSTITKASDAGNSRLRLTVQNSDPAGTTFTSSVSVDELTIKNDTKAVFQSTTSTGTLTTETGSTLTGRVSVAQSATINGIIDGGISWAAAEGATNTLILNTVYSGDASILTSIAVGSTINFGSEGKIVLGSEGGHSDALQGKDLALSASYTLNPAQGVKTIVTRMLIEGENIWYRDKALLDYGNLTLSEVSDAISTTRYDFYSDNTSANDAWVLNGTTVNIEDLEVGAYRYFATTDGGIGVQYVQYMLPEPSTATLSLLALAALAARRRRKG